MILALAIVKSQAYLENAMLEKYFRYTTNMDMLSSLTNIRRFHVRHYM